MPEGRVHQGLGGDAPVLFQQGLFQGAPVDPDADGDVLPGAGVGHGLHPLRVPDVAGVDAHLVCPGLDALQGQLVVEVNVHHQGQVDLLLDGPHRFGGGHVGHRHPDDLAPGGGQAADLLHRGLHVLGGGVGHGLNGPRRAAADGHASHENLFRHRQFTSFKMSLRVMTAISISRRTKPPACK